jgi:hypothetical protein
VSKYPGSILALLSPLVLIIAACGPAEPAVRADIDKSANFAAYHTFGFASPLGTDRSGYSSIVSTQLKQSTQREMEAHGYSYSATNPDLIVNFNTNVRTQTDVQSMPSAGVGYYGYRGGFYGGWPGQDVSTVHYKVGTLNVDVVDAKRKSVVWEGIAEGELTDQMMQNPQAAIDSVVTKVFQKFPPKSA